MNKKRLMTCLAAGVCILAVSATAAFGSVNGYGNYKAAVKALALQTDNVSAKGTFAMTYDGKSVMNGQVDIACDGANQSSHILMTDGETSTEEWNTTYNGVTTWFNSDDENYYTYETENEKSGHGLLNVSSDDELSNRIVNLMEMGADTVMGDLKNNVVQIGASDGIYTYQLDISNSQVPAIVNAGLSVLAYAASESVTNTYYVDFEDYDQTAVQYYQDQTGKTLSQDFLDHYNGYVDDDSWWQDNAELEEFQEVSGQIYDFYYQELDEKMEAANSTSGILYVAADGTATFYADVESYQQSKGETTIDGLETFIGKDLTLDNVHFTFSINKAGQLTANHMEATFTTVDQKGESHTVVLTGDADLFDYGSTVIQPLDVGDRLRVE